MALLTSGAISFLSLQYEFGGANPIGMNEYYRGGANVPTTVGTAAGGYSGWSAAHTNQSWIITNTGSGFSYIMNWNGTQVYSSTTAPGNGTYIANLGGYDYERNATAWTTTYPGKYGGNLITYYTQRRRVTGSSVTVNTGIPASGTISMNQYYGGRNT